MKPDDDTFTNRPNVDDIPSDTESDDDDDVDISDTKTEEIVEKKDNDDDNDEMEYEETDDDEDDDEEYEIITKAQKATTPVKKSTKKSTKKPTKKMIQDDSISFTELFNKITAQQVEIDLLKEQTKLKNKKKRFMNHVKTINSLSGRETKIIF